MGILFSLVPHEGGRDDGDGDASRDPMQDESIKTLMMWITLASLTVLFIASLIGFLWIRLQASPDNWPPLGYREYSDPIVAALAGIWEPIGRLPFPFVLLVSTLLIVASSVTMQLSLAAAKHDQPGRLKRWILATAGLGIAFLVLQGIAWYQMGMPKTPENLIDESTRLGGLYAVLFFFMTGLHGAHVIGGLVPLGIVTAKAMKDQYSSKNYSGVVYFGMYWHFLDIVWIAIFLLMFVDILAPLGGTFRQGDVDPLYFERQMGR